MKTASIRGVRHARRQRAQVKTPDVLARLKKAFGRRAISDKTMREILDGSRGSY